MAQNVKVPPLDEAPVTVVGSTPQSEFAFAFPFWTAADIIVLIDGLKLEGDAYSVEGLYVQNGDPVEGGYGSGVVILNEEVSNCSVTIDRFVVGSRLSQFSRAAPLGMPSLNSDINKLTARQQDIVRIVRGVQAGAVDPEVLAEVVEEATSDKANILLDNAIRFRSATGAVAASVNAVLDRMAPMPAEFGLTIDADLSDPVDQTAELQAMLDAAPQGGEGVGLNGTYYINTQLSLNEGRCLFSRTSTGEIFEQVGYGTRKGTIVLGPQGQIKLTNGAGLYGLNIIRLDAATPPDPTDPYGTYMRIQAWTDTAIFSQELIGSDSVIEDCTIIGFGVAAIFNYVERFRFVNNKIDCLGGVEASKVYDVSRVRDNQVWPFWTARLFDDAGTGVTADASGTGAGRAAYDSQPAGFYYRATDVNVLYWRVSATPGVWKSAFDIQLRSLPGFRYGDNAGGGVDGILSSGNLVFGHPNGFHMMASGTNGGQPARSYACHFYDNWIDGYGKAAFKFEGNVHEAIVSSNHVDSHETAVELNQNGSVHIRDLSVGGVSYAAVRIMSELGNGIIDGITQGGTTAHLIKVEGSAADLAPEGRILGYSISNLWPSGAVGSMIDCGDINARRALKIDHKTISRFAGGYDPRLFESYGQTILSSEQTISATGPAVIQFANSVQNGLGEWGVDYAHYPWADNSVYDYNLMLAFKADSAATTGEFSVEVYRNGVKIFRAFQTTITNDELKVFMIPVRLGNGAGQKIQFFIDSQIPGKLKTEFNNTRITYNRAL